MALNFKSQKPSLPYKHTQTAPCSPENDPRHHLLRISDILQEPDKDNYDDVPMDGDHRRTVVDCAASPRRIVGRWLSGLKKGKVKALLSLEGERKRERGRNSKEKERETFHRTAEAAPEGINGRDLVASSSVSGASLEPGGSGLVRKQNSFNLGIGCCLLYLVAASKNELHKIIDMRRQVEMLLENARDELRMKDAMSKPSKPDEASGYSTTDCENHPSTHVSPSSYAHPESPSITMSSQSLIYETPMRGGGTSGMEQLEAELKTELERLELHLGDDTLSGLEKQQSMEVTIAETVSSKSPSVGCGEVIDPEGAMAITEVQAGVPPHELERKLHELLESRQEEQIRELEAAVECLKQQLLEKEIEVSWWRETTRVISKHMPENSRLSLQHELDPCASSLK